MSEQLLTPTDVARKLRVSRATFYRMRGGLIAKGVKTILVGSHVRYLESSLDVLIRQAAEMMIANTGPGASSLEGEGALERLTRLARHIARLVDRFCLVDETNSVLAWAQPQPEHR